MCHLRTCLPPKPDCHAAPRSDGALGQQALPPHPRCTDRQVPALGADGLGREGPGDLVEMPKAMGGIQVYLPFKTHAAAVGMIPGALPCVIGEVVPCPSGRRARALRR